MMFSNEDIRAAIKSGELVIEPFNEDLLRAAGLTLHLGEQLLKPLPGKVVDVRSGSIPDYEEIFLAADRPYQLQPGEFLLGHTYEAVSVGASLGFLIEGRSTLARVGLTVVQTAMLVYPGHRNRTVTLELANHGPNPVLLYPKMKVARVVICELRTPSTQEYDEKGKYREQRLVGKPIFKDEFLKES